MVMGGQLEGKPRSGDSNRSIQMGTYSKLTYHIVFSTKLRRPAITNPIRERLYEYIGGIIRGQNGSLLEIGGVEDHVHILTNFSPTLAISNLIRDIKANSSKWLNALPESKMRFEWQKGYGAFTVSYSQIDVVRRYIQHQEEHHRTVSFEGEYVRFLERHGIEYERRFVFETEQTG